MKDSVNDIGTPEGYLITDDDLPPNKITFSVKEVAEMVSVSKSKIYQQMRAGYIEAIQLSERREVISRKEVLRIANGYAFAEASL
jgi:excisionase family DNA binding protein